MNVSVQDLTVTVASPDDAAAMVDVIHAAFGARPALDPPSTAIEETPESVRAAMSRGGGIYATVAGRPAGVILVAPAEVNQRVTFQRVSVHPDFQRHGVASAMTNQAGVRAGTLPAESNNAELNEATGAQVPSGRPILETDYERIISPPQARRRPGGGGGSDRPRGRGARDGARTYGRSRHGESGPRADRGPRT